MLVEPGGRPVLLGHASHHKLEQVRVPFGHSVNMFIKGLVEFGLWGFIGDRLLM